MTGPGLSAEDTMALHQLVYRYAHLVDDGEFSRLGEIFTEDIEFDASAFGNAPLSGLAPVIQSFVEARHPVAHHVTSPVVSTDADGTVRVRSKVISLLSGGVSGSGSYDDIAVKTAVGWRIRRRVISLRRESDLKKSPPRPAT